MRTRASVLIVGAGMVGLTLAIDLRLRGVDAVLIERRQTPAEGSRSICQAKRTLEIWDRLGVGAAIRDRGVTWTVGRVFHGDEELFAFDLQPEPGHKMPAFVNLQQSLVEDLLRARYAELGGVVETGRELLGFEAGEAGVAARVRDTDGDIRRMSADWLVSCEGARSTVRRQMGLAFSGQVFEDRFLICDVKMRGDFPAERRFWFAPPFHDGQTALLHKQADDVWRIDLPLGRDADPELERRPERARPRIARMVGHDAFDFAWISTYAFQCRTLERYVHGRVIFAGDAAHQVSPFGARGGNGGVQDADNLGWKLARVIEGRADARLLDSYDAERRAAAAENILHSTRATDFMSPKSAASRLLRDAALDLAGRAPFGRALVNSGRLSRPTALPDSPWLTPDDAPWAECSAGPGAAAVDAPVTTPDGRSWLLELLDGGFTLLSHGVDLPERLSAGDEPVRVLALGRDVEDAAGLVARRYDLTPGACVLLRPDQHVILRRRRFEPEAIAVAVRRALGESADA